jgi:2-polyprenyl-3-methyl-5-hydroxy-6-metoxy-1,4-benzoquinol methylase
VVADRVALQDPRAAALAAAPDRERRHVWTVRGTERLLQRQVRRAAEELHVHLRLQPRHQSELQERAGHEHGSEAGLQRAVPDELQLGLRQHGLRHRQLPTHGDLQLTIRSPSHHVDEYTARTRDWLNERFRRPRGAEYVPHQPVFGFEAARRAGLLWDYVRIFRIISAASRLRFETLLDVGAAEGLVATLARELLGASVEATDLSEEACERARECFGLRSTPADVHQLPFSSESFDVVVCSETLEHVTDVERAVGELLRVAKVAVVITVPHESPAVVDANRRNAVPHGHIHSFDAQSFAKWAPRGGLRVEPLGCTALRPIPLALEGRALHEARARALGDRVTRLYERARPTLRELPAQRVVDLVVASDELACRVTGRCEGTLAVLMKTPGAYRSRPTARIESRDITGFSAQRAPVRTRS